jgi:ATP-dependent DNA ligase
MPATLAIGLRYPWTDRYPWIVETARKLRLRRFVLDGEAVVLGVDGVSDFNALHSRRTTRRCSSVLSIFRSMATTRPTTICASCR